MDKMSNMDDLYNFGTRMLRKAMISHIKQSALFSLFWLLLITLVANRLFLYTLFGSIVSGFICGVILFVYLVFLYTRQYRRQVQELAKARLRLRLNDSLYQSGTFRRHVFGDRTTEETNPPTE